MRARKCLECRETATKSINGYPFCLPHALGYMSKRFLGLMSIAKWDKKYERFVKGT